MTEEFDYLVSPDCFDSAISFVPGTLDVQYVYGMHRDQDCHVSNTHCSLCAGSPGFEHPKAGLLFEMPSSFPSLKDSPTMTKGGVMLIKTAMPTPGTTLEFK